MSKESSETQLSCFSREALVYRLHFSSKLHILLLLSENTRNSAVITAVICEDFVSI